MEGDMQTKFQGLSRHYFNLSIKYVPPRKAVKMGVSVPVHVRQAQEHLKMLSFK